MRHLQPPAFVAWAVLAAGTLAGAGQSFGRQGDGALETAKSRYGAAAYEEALAILDAAKPAQADIDQRAEIEKYRALSLLALGRKADAERSIERLVALKPQVAADQLEASPWVRETFRTTRRRVLPRVVEERYEQAKAAVLRKSFPEATDRLKEVLLLLDDRDLAAAGEPWRRDLKTLAQGFLDLAGAVTSVSPPRAPVTKPADAPVVPAVPIIETMPRWPPYLANFVLDRNTATGVIEVTVDEEGRVSNAVMRESIQPVYDALLIEAARSRWRYRPATKAGVAVPCSRRIRVVVNVR